MGAGIPAAYPAPEAPAGPLLAVISVDPQGRLPGAGAHVLPGCAAGRGTRPAQPVVVGINTDFPPYEFVDAQGEAQGFDVDLLRGTAQATGLRHPLPAGPLGPDPGGPGSRAHRLARGHAPVQGAGTLRRVLLAQPRGVLRHLRAQGQPGHPYPRGPAGPEGPGGERQPDARAPEAPGVLPGDPGHRLRARGPEDSWLPAPGMRPWCPS